MDIKTHNYTATPAEIHAMATAYFESQDTVAEGRTTYLRALVATAQETWKGATETEQIEIVNAVHEAFYAEVIKAAQESIPPRTPERAKEINRRSNFARSSLSTLRGWIRHGGDLMKIKARAVTKGTLAVERKPQQPSAKRLSKLVERQSKALVAALIALGEIDRDSARAELDTLIGQFANQLQDLGTKMTHRAGRTFVPVTQTQVLRQLANPS